MTVFKSRMFGEATQPPPVHPFPITPLRQVISDHKLAPTLAETKADQQDPLQNQQCRVCGEPAAGFHFGAFTCEGCKSFFGRTCNNQSVIQECKNNYRCVVDKKNRTACKACRLRKCLMVGMSKSGSRYGRRSNWFKIHCLMQNQQQPKVPPPPYSSPHISAATTTAISWPPPTEHLLKPPSRSPSPLPSSTNPTKLSPPILLPPSNLHSLYPFPPPLPFLTSPFHRLSPLLTSNHILANSLLFSMVGQKAHNDLLKEPPTTPTLPIRPKEEAWPIDMTRPIDLTVVRPEAQRIAGTPPI